MLNSCSSAAEVLQVLAQALTDALGEGSHLGGVPDHRLNRSHQIHDGDMIIWFMILNRLAPLSVQCCVVLFCFYCW